MSWLLPIELRCSRCSRLVDVVAHVDTEYGDAGSVLSTWLEYEVTPECPGYVECEAHDGYTEFHPPIDSCNGLEGSPRCPFDGQDDYQSIEEAVVIGVLRDRRRYGRPEKGEL